MDIKKPQLVKVEAFVFFFKGEFCNTFCDPPRVGEPYALH